MAEITKNPEKSRYELHVDDELVGFIDFRDVSSSIELPHTEVDPAHGGQGYAGQLAKFALDDVRAQGKTVVPTCPFIADYIDKHEEYRDLLE